jgi:RHS repeat-associated protein
VGLECVRRKWASREQDGRHDRRLVNDLYDGDAPVCELNSSGSVTATNTFGADGLLYRHAGSSTTYYTFDPNGSVAERLNSGGTVVSADFYDGYGKQTSAESAAPDCFGYGAQAGYYTDTETGLVLCTHRFYDPGTGRWVSRDPAGSAGGINLYGYCGNGPIGAWDSSGYDENTDLMIMRGSQIVGTAVGIIGGVLTIGGGGSVATAGVGAVPSVVVGAAVGGSVGFLAGTAVGGAAIFVKARPG